VFKYFFVQKQNEYANPPLQVQKVHKEN